MSGIPNPVEIVVLFAPWATLLCLEIPLLIKAAGQPIQSFDRRRYLAIAICCPLLIHSFLLIYGLANGLAWGIARIFVPDNIGFMFFGLPILLTIIPVVIGVRQLSTLNKQAIKRSKEGGSSD